MLKSILEYISSVWSPQPTGSCWDDLPDVVVIRILSFLQKQDRARASQISQKWANAFKSPSLWFSASVAFDGHPGKADHRTYKTYKNFVSPVPIIDNKKAILFAQALGEYLRDMDIQLYRCEVEEFANEAIEQITTFIKILTSKKCSLRKLHISGGLRIDSEPFMKKSEPFIDAWIQFIGTQNQINELRFTKWETESAMEVFAAAVEASGATLQSIVCRPIVIHTDPLQQMNKNHFDLFSKLPNLRFIELPYERLNVQTLLNIVNHSRHLRTIRLFFFKKRYKYILRNGYSQDIGLSSADWIKAVEKCRHLQIEVIGVMSISSVYIPIILPPCMPAKTLVICIDPSDLGDWSPGRFFLYLKNTFASTLVKLWYRQPFRMNTDEDIFENITSFLLSCSKLRFLRLAIEKETPVSFVENLYKMQRNKQIDIHKMELEFYSSDDDIQTTMAITVENFNEPIFNSWRLSYTNLAFLVEDNSSDESSEDSSLSDESDFFDYGTAED